MHWHAFESVADPLEITVHPLQPATDEFVIIASDGLWDVYSSQEAVTLVQKALKSESVTRAPRDTRAQILSKILVESAYHAGSTDNVTAIIVMLDFSHIHTASL